VATCSYATVLGRDGATVETVEHLLAALVASGIDNVVIELSQREVPIMDGSSAPFLFLLQEAGPKTLTAPRRVLKVLRPVQEVWGIADAEEPAPGTEKVAFTELRSEIVEIPAAGAATFSIGAYPGPLDPRLLAVVDPYAPLRMDGLILYLISGCCSFCTFSWLANASCW